MPDGILNNSSLQYVRDYIEQHYRIRAVVSLPQTAFKHYEAGVKPSILFLQKFTEEEYSLYQANIHQITGENEAIYMPRVTELEKDRKKVIEVQGCPAQVAVTEIYQPRFRATLDNIEDLNRKLDKKPTQIFLRWRERFVRDTSLEVPQEFELYDEKAASNQLKTHHRDLTALVKEYKEQYKAASDSEWEDQIKEEYKERIDAVKEALADKNAEDIRQWVRENANHPIFMAMAERIGYDATGRRDPVNDLEAIYDEYQRFRGDPDFFRVSPDRENQIFLTYRGDILEIERLDPSPYQALRTNSINAIKSSKYQWINLKDAVKFRREIVSDSSELPYVGMENIQSNTGFYVPSTEEKETFNSALKFEVGDVLFPKLNPYLNKVHLAQFRGVCSTEFHVLKGINLNNLYLSTFLSSRLVLNQTTCLMTGSALSRLQTQEVERLPILLPPPEIQNDIAEIMQSAYTAKKQKDQEADALLDSIDDYILTELGIEMPAVKEKKCFVVYAGETTGRRVDSFYYQSKFRSVDQIVENVRFDVFNLGVLISEISSGATPKVDENYYTDSSDGVPFLRVQNVTSQGIDLSDAKFITREVHNGTLKRSQLKKDDLVFTITGRIGSVAVVPDNFEGNINQHSVRFHLTEQITNITINPSYVAAFLNSELGKSLAIREVTGATRPALDYKALKSLKIILPPIEIQNEIVTEAKNRLAKVVELRHEADAIVEAAKEEIVSILLAG